MNPVDINDDQIKKNPPAGAIRFINEGGVLKTLDPNGVRTPVIATTESVLALINGAIDPRTIPGMIAGYDIANTVRTGSLIDSWTDISGNGRHAVASGTKSTVYGTAPNEYGSSEGVNHYVPADPIPVTSAGMTIVCIYGGKRLPAGYTTYNSVAALSYDGGAGLGLMQNNGAVQFFNPTRQIGVHFETGDMNSFAARFGAAETAYITNGVKFTGAANTSSVIEIDKIWGYSGPGAFQWQGERCRIYVYNRTLSDTEIAGIEAYHGVQTVTRPLYIIDDSFGMGVGATSQQTGYSRLLELATGGSCIGTLCQNGATTESPYLPNAILSIEQALAAGLSPDIYYGLGKNNLAAGATAAALEILLDTHIPNLKATGVPLIMYGAPPRTTGFSGGANAASYAVQKGLFNAICRVRTDWYDAFVDVENDPYLGIAANYPDGVHANDAGHARLAQLLAAARYSI